MRAAFPIPSCAQSGSHMIRINEQPPIIPSPPANKSTPVVPAEKIKKDPQEHVPVKPFVERRKNNERRNRDAGRGPYSSRSGKDRRKNRPPGNSIDIDV